MSYLIDTNVLSELRRKTPSANVVAWISGIQFGSYFQACMSGRVRYQIDDDIVTDQRPTAPVLGNVAEHAMERTTYHAPRAGRISRAAAGVTMRITE